MSTLKTFVKNKFRLHYIFILTVCLSSYNCFSETAGADTIPNSTKHGISLQLGGAQILGSVHYENVLHYTPKKQVIGRVGLGVLFTLFIPSAGFSVLLGQTNHLEIGVDAGPVLGTDGSAIVSPILGYRYQNFKKPSTFFLIGFSPLIIRNFSSNEEFSIFPFGKIGFGFNF